MRDLYDLNTDIRDRMDVWMRGCANCKSEIHEKITELDGRVETLEIMKTEKQANHRSWRDYVVNGTFAAGVAFISFMLGRSS
jgi:hypothetical protein